MGAGDRVCVDPSFEVLPCGDFDGYRVGGRELDDEGGGEVAAMFGFLFDDVVIVFGLHYCLVVVCFVWRDCDDDTEDLRVVFVAVSLLIPASTNSLTICLIRSLYIKFTGVGDPSDSCMTL